MRWSRTPPITDCWLYALTWLTIGCAGAFAAGCTRGNTTALRTTTQTSTALTSGTKIETLLLDSPYPWGAFRPELGAETLAGPLRYRERGHLTRQVASLCSRLAP